METTFSSEIYSYFKVLIVPCGMETRFSAISMFLKSVLIVPCGMETASNYFVPICHNSINCTLWNGNTILRQ